MKVKYQFEQNLGIFMKGSGYRYACGS